MEDPDSPNVFAPFASELDWRIAEWVIKDGPGHKAFDRLLEIPGVREKLGLSYQNIRGLHQIVDSIPERAETWMTKSLSFPDHPHKKHIIRYRDPLAAIRSLLGNPAHAKDIVYVPKKVFSDATRDNRIYNEMWTGKWWTAVQSKLPKGAALSPIIIATDKTQLTQFSGGKSAYPVYLTLGNIPKALRRKPFQSACILIGYLSVDKILRTGLTKQTIKTHNQKLFHVSMRLILQPLIEAGTNGMEVVGGDGNVRLVFPILASYVADYPEQCLVGCTKYGTCPKWTENKFHDYCMEHEVAGIHRPFWEGFPLTNLSLSLTPDKGISLLSQYSTHDDGTLSSIDYFITATVREDFNIPKFHSLLHYVESIQFFGTTDNYNTEMFECLHIDFAKNGWRASNRRDEFPQMITWLGRQEKISLFSAYLAWLESTRKPAPLPFVRTFTGQAIQLAKKPQSPRQLLTTIELNHSTDSFLHTLKEFLNNNSLRPTQLCSATLPFSRLDVYHNFKFEPSSLDPIAGAGENNPEDFQTVTARLQSEDHTSPARFNTVIARNNSTAEATELSGKSPQCSHFCN
ncbi:hypothetical protein B0H14DRAFT_3656681 [Mycena olivaceomarginata]|nr:hypothetical protein B0H14DRAFT_3656681 [Mycena olivaceomarginata]